MNRSPDSILAPGLVPAVRVLPTWNGVILSGRPDEPARLLLTDEGQAVMAGMIAVMVSREAHQPPQRWVFFSLS